MELDIKCNFSGAAYGRTKKFHKSEASKMIKLFAMPAWLTTRN